MGMQDKETTFFFIFLRLSGLRSFSVLIVMACRLLCPCFTPLSIQGCPLPTTNSEDNPHYQSPRVEPERILKLLAKNEGLGEHIAYSIVCNSSTHKHPYLSKALKFKIAVSLLAFLKCYFSSPLFNSPVVTL